MSLFRSVRRAAWGFRREIPLPAWLRAAFFAVSVAFVSTAAAQVNVLTQHNDIGRTGQNLNETILTPALVSSGSFGKLFSVTVDGQVYTQPLYLSNLSLPGAGSHNVVFVATEHDSVYAFDADTGGTPLWKVSLLDAAHGAAAGATPDPVTDTQCNEIAGPEHGVTGTPVIDPVAGTIYLVGKTVENGYPVQRLHALDVTTGAEKANSPVAITASVPGTGVGSSNGSVAFDPKWENQRPGLLLLNGIVYLGFGSHCDFGPYHGWVIAYNASTLKQTSAFNTTPNGTGSGIWMSGAGLAADVPTGSPFGRMFFTTGNGTYDATVPYTTNNADYGDDVLRLDLTNGVMTVSDAFTPFEQASLNANDLDLSAGGVMLLPDQNLAGHPHQLITAGKTGTIYVLDRDNLGGYSGASAVDNDLKSIVNQIAGLFAVPAYWNQNVYIWSQQDWMTEFQFTAGLMNGYYLQYTSDTQVFPGSTPSISANGSTNGIVWAIDSSAASNNGNAKLLAYDAVNIKTSLYSSATNASDNPGLAVKFAVPTIVNGKVYVGAYGQLSVYGMQTADFTLTPFSTSATVTPGGSVSDSIAIGSLNGFSGNVTLSATGLPSGVTASFTASTTTAGTIVATFNATAAAATGTSTVTITGTSGALSHTATVSLTVGAATTSASTTPFVTAQTPGALRNNFSGFVGMKFTTGSTPFQVYSLGRFTAAGNSGTHLVKLVLAGSGVDVPGGSVSLTVSGQAGQYQYAALAAPISLLANTAYYLVSQETSGGDQWYDIGPVTVASVAAVNAPTYGDSGGNYYPVAGLAGQSYVPVNFLYGFPSAPLSVAITSPQSGATLSGSAAAITVATTGTVASLQLQVDGVNQGSPNVLTLNTTLLSNGAHALSVVATDASGNTVRSASVSIAVNNTKSGVPFIFGQTPGALRNNFTGLVGFSLTTGTSPVYVTSLGRFAAAGNSGTHLLKLVNSNGTDVANGSVSVSLAGSTAGQYVYGSLPYTLALPQNTTYYLVSQETAGGDQWYDYGFVSNTAAVSVNGPVYAATGSAYTALTGLSGQAFVPVNFTYLTTAQTQTITFSSIATQSVGVPLTLTASASSGLPVSYSSSTPTVCTVSGSSATFLTNGTCTLVASQAGNAAYAAASPVSQSFTVSTSQAFGLSLAANTLTLANGVGGTMSIVLTPSSGFTGTVTFTATGIPANVSYTFLPASSTTGGLFVAYVQTGAVAGTYPVTITGTSGSAFVSANLSLIIPAAMPSYTLAVTSGVLSLTRPAGGSVMVNITPINGFSGGIAFSASGLPAGLSSLFFPATSGTGSMIAFYATTAVTPGTYLITISGTSGALIVATTLSLVIN